MAPAEGRQQPGSSRRPIRPRRGKSYAAAADGCLLLPAAGCLLLLPAAEGGDSFVQPLLGPLFALLPPPPVLRPPPLPYFFFFRSSSSDRRRDRGSRAGSFEPAGEAAAVSGRVWPHQDLPRLI